MLADRGDRAFNDQAGIHDTLYTIGHAQDDAGDRSFGLIKISFLKYVFPVFVTLSCLMVIAQAPPQFPFPVFKKPEMIKPCHAPKLRNTVHLLIKLVLGNLDRTIQSRPVIERIDGFAPWHELAERMVSVGTKAIPDARYKRRLGRRDPRFVMVEFKIIREQAFKLAHVARIETHIKQQTVLGADDLGELSGLYLGRTPERKQEQHHK